MRIAIAVFEGAEELDFAGPWEVLGAWRFLYPDDVELVMVGESAAPVTCAKGMRVLPEVRWQELGDVDVLVYLADGVRVRNSVTRLFESDCALSRTPEPS
jgi:putative intracellular protease/amidase